MTIAVEALKDGSAVPGGLLPEEASEALRIHADHNAMYRARLPWETEPTYPTAEPVDGDVEVFWRTPDE